MYGTQIFLGDNGFSLINLDFRFKYNGNEYTQVSIGSNGYVCLGLIKECRNRLRPSHNDILVGLNYDLDTTREGSGKIYYKSINDSPYVSLYMNLLDPQFVPKNIFVIKYDNLLPHIDAGSNSRVSFQIYLLTDSIKSYVIFKFTSCPADLNQLASAGLNFENEGKWEEIPIYNGKECLLSNVGQNGVWISEVTKYSLGK